MGGLMNQDRAKQERLLRLAGWLSQKHNAMTRVPGTAYTEVRFTRADMDDIPELIDFSNASGDTGLRALERATKDLERFSIEVESGGESRIWVSRASALTERECRALAAAALHVLVEDGSSGPDGYHIPGAGLTEAGADVIVAYAPTIDEFIEAVRTKTSVRIVHRGTERIVDPWHVFMTDGRWYVVGRDHDADDRRAFAIDAISDVDLHGAPGSFVIPRRDFEELSRRAIDPDEWTSAEPVDVELEVDPRLVGRAETMLGAERVCDTLTPDWVPMTCTIRHLDAFITRLWGLRARAVVTGPPSVREAVIAALEEMR